MNDTKRISYEPVAGLLPRPVLSPGAHELTLPKPDQTGGMRLMSALSERKSGRSFAERALTSQQLSDLLWSAAGINRPHQDGHTVPSPYGERVVDLYAALPGGLYKYDSAEHRLVLKRHTDVRSLTGYQDFVGAAPLDLIYVVTLARMQEIPPPLRETFAAATAGAMAENVYLYCASAGLTTVVRGWLNRRLLAEHMSLNEDEEPILSQTVGYPNSVGAVRS